MGVLTAFLALLSCALVGTGVWLVLRDVRRTQALRQVESSQVLATGPYDVPAAPVEPRPSEFADRGIGDGGTIEAADVHTAAVDWRDVFETSLNSALRAVNGAFAPAGITLVPSPASAAAVGTGEQAFAVALMAQEQPAGSLQIQVEGHEVEIVASPLSAGIDMVRRVRRLKGADTSIPILAEAIAACAWPVVAAKVAPTRR